MIEQENQEFPIYQESTPYNSHRLPHENGQTVPSNEDAILHGSDGIFFNSLFKSFILISFSGGITLTSKLSKIESIKNILFNKIDHFRCEEFGNPI